MTVKRWECQHKKCRFADKHCDIKKKIFMFQKSFGDFVEIKISPYDCPDYQYDKQGGGF